MTVIRFLSLPGTLSDATFLVSFLFVSPGYYKDLDSSYDATIIPCHHICVIKITRTRRNDAFMLYEMTFDFTASTRVLQTLGVNRPH